ncbi:MAG: hypothetical protein JW795_16615 [Chitinivibrionales bacterium]|nr:hypothetical protein [Chitinivibrionales bacterium]
MVSIAALQMDIVWHRREANFTTARALGLEAKNNGAEMLILPEMFATGFSMETNVTAEPIDGPTPQFLRSLARELDVAVVGGFVLKQTQGKPHNVTIAIDNKGNDLALYAKMHCISTMGEDRAHAEGSDVSFFSYKGVRFSLFICYDLRFPSLFSAAALGSDCMIVIASWPNLRQSHWDILLQARAIENQCYVVGVNRVGSDGEYLFAGGSMIVDPSGVVLEKLNDNKAIAMAAIDQNQVTALRARLPFLKDRKSLPFESRLS